MPSLNKVSQPLVDAVARGLHRRQILAATERQGFRRESLGPDRFRLIDAEERAALLSFQPDGGVRTEAADGGATTRWFDSEGRLARCLDAAGVDFTASAAPGGGRRFSRAGFGDFVVAHDPFGLPTRFEFPDGTHSSIDWDAPGGETITDRAGNVCQRLRDEEGRQVGAIDARGGRTAYAGDETSPFIEVRSPAGRRDRFELDSSGALAAWRVNDIEIAQAKGISIGNLPGEIHYSDGHWARYETKDGRLTAAHGPNGTVRLIYDDAGRLVAEDQNGLVVRYQRDRTGLLTGIRLPDGAQVGFRWDASGKLAGAADWDGGFTRLAWAASGQIAEIAHPNGARTGAESDPIARITAISTRAAGGDVLHEAQYRYDVMDRLVDAVENGVARRHSYDPLGRLTGTASADPAVAEQWELDAAGNRLIDRGIRYDADPDNRISGTGRHTIDHDLLGRVCRARLPAGMATLHHNGQGQLIRAEVEGGVLAEYGYDALGRRVWKRVNGRVTRYLWAGQTLLSEIRDAGPGWTRRDHLFLPDLFLPVAMRVDGVIYRQHCDRRATPVALTGPDGSCAWRATLKPFGTARLAAARIENPWRLINQYHDEETGLHYNLARYMHPELGRYLTPDPLFAAANRGNHYVFAGGDPLDGCDPTGELPQLLAAVLIGGAVGAVIGAGVKIYETRNQDWSWDRAAEIGKAAVVGGLMGMAGVLAGAAVVAAFPAEVGVAAAMGIGGLAGAVTAVVELCVHAAYYDQAVTAEEVATSAALGFGVGAVTFGAGAVAAQRARRAAQELAEAEAAALRREAARRAAEAEAEALKRAAAQKAAEAQPITITEKGLKHTTDRHTNGGPPKYANKSKFNDNESVVDLVSSGAGQPTVVQPNGNLARTWDVGRNVGLDRATGNQTSVMTVITKPNGELVTAFPGRP